MLIAAFLLAALFFVLWRAERNAFKRARKQSDENEKHLIGIGMAAGRIAEKEENVAFIGDRRESFSPHHSYSLANRPTNGNAAS